MYLNEKKSIIVSPCAPGVRAHRICIKSFVIVAFFVLAALHSWIQGDVSDAGPQPPRQLVASDLGSMRHVLEADNDTEDTVKQCAGIDRQPPEQRCKLARLYCGEDSGRSLVNYLLLHFCSMGGKAWVSVPVLVGVVILAFHFLAETAEHYFSPVVGRLVEILGMSPSMGGVTLLAFGNGAPDVFASLAAIGAGNSRIGLGAILSAGTFVSAFVVGSVALTAAPFSVRPMPFVRDVLFYSFAVCMLFVVYLRGVIMFWQAIGFMAFYALFVVVVMCTDKIKVWDSGNTKPSKLGSSRITGESDVRSPKWWFLRSRKESKKAPEDYSPTSGYEEPYPDKEDQAVPGALALDVLAPKDGKDSTVGSGWAESGCCMFSKCPLKGLLVCSQARQVILWMQVPSEVLLKATIPEVDPLKWNRGYATANIVLCPLLALYMCSSLVALNRHIIFLAPSLRLPIWILILLQGAFMGTSYYLAVKHPPESGQLLTVIVAFVMSVFWISFIAGELLGCLVTLGLILGVSPALLGLTVLAWGNSIGDLVADVAVARVGQPAMAVAGCFAGPMFNMLIGLGSALSLQTAREFPVGYSLDHHPGILIAFGFLFLTLLGSLLVVTWSKFQVTRSWGICLIGCYCAFMVLSVIVANLFPGNIS